MTPRASPALLAAALAACAADTIVGDEPRAMNEYPIAPFEVQEECGRLAAGDRLDYRFEARAPVTFNLYYKEGTTFLAPISRENVTDDSGVYTAPMAQRYCLRWEAGRQGAIISYRIRLLAPGAAR